MKAAEYAKAIYELGERADIKKVRQALLRRKHVKLLPQIFAEYQKLALAQTRLAVHKKITPQKDRNRTLLELYRKLTHV